MITISNIYKELFSLFIKLGFFAYGGPAAHISMMNDEVVVKRKWFSEEEFLDLISFTNLIPGPNSTEIAILIGYKKAGIKGLLIAGLSFILPAVMIVIIFTSIYLKSLEVPQVNKALLALSPVMIAIILNAFLRMAKNSMKDKKTLIFLVISLILLFKINEISVLLIMALLSLINFSKIKSKIFVIEPVSSTVLFLTFLKIGSLLYGSGYVLISFLQSEFVNKMNLLSSSELMNLVMIGEITPGPVFTTATAIGYYLNNLSGAFFATIGIFTPSFLLIFFLYPIYEKIKANEIIRKMLKGVSVASLAILLKVVLDLSIGIKSNPILILMATVYSYLIYKYKINSILLIIISMLISLFFF